MPRRTALLLLPLAALALLALVLTLTSSASASNCTFGQTLLLVDDDYASAVNANQCQFRNIADGMPYARAGDTMLVANGNYTPPINYFLLNVSDFLLVGESQSGVRLLSAGGFDQDVVLVLGDNVTIAYLTVISPFYKGIETIGGGAVNAIIVNVTVSAPTPFIINAYHTTLRNVTVNNSGTSFIGTIGNTANAFDFDNLRMTNMTGAADVWNVNGNDGVFSRLDVSAPNAASILRFSSTSNNVTVLDSLLSGGSLGSPALNGVLTAGGSLTLRNVTIRFVRNGMDVQAWGNVSVLNSTIIQNLDYGLYLNQAGNFSASSTVINASTTGIYLRSSNFANFSSVGIGHNANAGIVLANAGRTSSLALYNSLIVNASTAILSGSGARSLLVDGSRISSLPLGYDGFGLVDILTVSNSLFENISNLAWRQVQVNSDWHFENNTFTDSARGMSFSGTRATLVNNTFRNISGIALSYYGDYGTVASNTFTNCSVGLSLPTQPYTQAVRVNTMSPENMVDGRPFYYIHGAANFTVPSNASGVYVFDSSNITVEGVHAISPGYAGFACQGCVDVTVRNSTFRGTDYGLYFSETVRMVLDNVSVEGFPLSNIAYIHETTLGTFSNLSFADSLYGSHAVLVSRSTNSTLSHLFVNHSVPTAVGIFDSSDIHLEDSLILSGTTGAVTLNNAFRTVVSRVVATSTLSTFVPVDSHETRVVDSSFTSLLAAAANTTNMQRSSIFNSTFTTNISWCAYFTRSNNLTVENSTFYSHGYYAAIVFQSPDFRSFNSTYRSDLFRALSFNIESYNSTAIHNNFYGTPVSTSINLPAVFDGGYLVGGNFYGELGLQLDDYSGPSQNILGKDGINDTRHAVGAGGRWDNYPLMDPWPPTVDMTSPGDGTLFEPGMVLNFSISNFFDLVTWSDSLTGASGTLSYPHDLDTTGWVDGLHTVTITASDPYAPTVVRVYTFTVDSTAPVLSADPPLGTAVIAQGTLIIITITEPNLDGASYTLDGNTSSGAPPFAINTSGLAPGNHTLTIYAIDLLLHTASYTWNFYLDAAPPTLTRIDPPDGFYRPGLHMGYTATDDYAIASVDFVAIPRAGGPPVLGLLVPDGSVPSQYATVLSLADGCYDVFVTATDAAGHTTVDTPSLCIDSTPPNLAAFAGYAADEDVVFTFHGEMAVDLDPELNYTWDFGGDSLLARTILNGVNPNFTFATPANYIVYLTAVDRAGNRATQGFLLTVADHTAPTPSFTLPATWPEDVPLLLDASNSTDNDAYWAGGVNATYAWVVDCGGENLTASTKVANVTIGTPALCAVSMWVVDTGGNRAVVSLSVVIEDTTPPTAVITGRVPVVLAGSAVALDGSTSSDNDPRFNLTFAWTVAYRGATVAQTTPAFNFTFDDPGNYTVTLEVTDGAGLKGSATASFRVNAAPSIAPGAVPPTLALLPGGATTWTLDLADSDDAASALTVIATSSDPSTVSVETRLENGSWVVKVTPLKPGAANVTVSVRDAQGATTSTTSRVTVGEAPMTPVPAGGFPLGLLLLVAVAAAVAAVLLLRRGKGGAPETAQEPLKEAPATEAPEGAAPAEDAAEEETDAVAGGEG